MKLLSRLQKKFSRADRQNASVNDYTSASQLRSALMGGRTEAKRVSESRSQWNTSPSIVESDDSTEASSRSGPDGYDVAVESAPAPPSSVWKLSVVDEANAKPQTMEDEMKRLKVLQSYFLLDSASSTQADKEQSQREFDRITKLVQLIFPGHEMISMISLVDMGRQYWLSQVGMEGAGISETARTDSFCAHTILERKNRLIVPDTAKDPRFRDNVFVKNAPHVRFYAGVCLTTPEGYNIGTLCAISTKDGMNGPIHMTANQIAQLEGLGQLAMDIIISRRERFIKREYERRSLELADVFRSTSSSIYKTVTDLQNAKDKFAPSPQAKSVLTKAMQSLTIQSKVCSATSRTLLEQDPELAALETMHDFHTDTSSRPTDENNDAVDNNEGDGSSYLDYTVSPKPNSFRSHSSNGNDGARDSTVSVSSSVIQSVSSVLQDDLDDILYPTTDMVKMHANLNRIVSSFPSKGNRITIEFVKGVPLKMVAEDLLLFKCCLHMIIDTMQRHGRDPTDKGESSDSGRLSVNRIHLRVRVTGNRDDLIVECEQQATAATLLSSAQARQMFRSPNSLLHSVSTMVRTMDGTTGFYQGKFQDDKDSPNNIIWFKVPLQLPGTYHGGPSSVDSDSADDRLYLTQTITQVHGNKQKEVDRAFLSPRTTTYAPRGSTLRDDPMQAKLLMQRSCLGLE